MTIHWKALEEHFLTVPFIVVFWGGKWVFLNFNSKGKADKTMGLSYIL
jgi:hypothetical protein